MVGTELGDIGALLGWMIGRAPEGVLLMSMSVDELTELLAMLKTVLQTVWMSGLIAVVFALFLAITTMMVHRGLLVGVKSVHYVAAAALLHIRFELAPEVTGTLLSGKFLKVEVLALPVAILGRALRRNLTLLLVILIRECVTGGNL